MTNETSEITRQPAHKDSVLLQFTRPTDSTNHTADSLIKQPFVCTCQCIVCTPQDCSTVVYAAASTATPPKPPVITKPPTPVASILIQFTSPSTIHTSDKQFGCTRRCVIHTPTRLQYSCLCSSQHCTTSCAPCDYKTTNTGSQCSTAYIAHCTTYCSCHSVMLANPTSAL